MTVSEITTAIIQFSDGNIHDIEHLLKVHAYAKTIGECEGLDADTLFTLEIAALVHDIACPLCREKYGNTNGKYQEAEGEILARDFLRDKGLPAQTVDRAVFLVAHHHTPGAVDGPDYRILLEADYLVNASESGYPKDAIQNARKNLYRTRAGIALLQAVYGVQ